MPLFFSFFLYSYHSSSLWQLLCDTCQFVHGLSLTGLFSAIYSLFTKVCSSIYADPLRKPIPFFCWIEKIVTWPDCFSTEFSTPDGLHGSDLLSRMNWDLKLKAWLCLCDIGGHNWGSWIRDMITREGVRYSLDVDFASRFFMWDSLGAKAERHSTRITAFLVCVRVSAKSFMVHRPRRVWTVLPSLDSSLDAPRGVHVGTAASRSAKIISYLD